MEDHPRLCGEKNAVPQEVPPAKGSPPPMRGKAKMKQSTNALCGITPAYAGKSHILELAETIIEDHPRLCGEKRKKPAYVRMLPGSPPPMRGKVERVYFEPQDLRITPAYAGKRR